jgi:hypothetical protein
LGGVAPGSADLQYIKSQAHLSWAAELAEGLSFHVEAGAGGCWYRAAGKGGGSWGCFSFGSKMVGVDNMLTCSTARAKHS